MYKRQVYVGTCLLNLVENLHKKYLENIFIIFENNKSLFWSIVCKKLEIPTLYCSYLLHNCFILDEVFSVSTPVSSRYSVTNKYKVAITKVADKINLTENKSELQVKRGDDE